MTKGIFIIEKLNKEKINKAKELGVNAVFTGHKNLEKKQIDSLKKEKIRIYAEIGLFADEELWQKYPDARPIDRDGKLIKKIHWYGGVCPNHPQVRKNRVQLIKLIIKSFNIDGIWLDFIRYPCHWEVLNPDLTEYCFCPNCLEKFKKEVGGEPKGERWIQWKCDQITNFVAETRDLLHRLQGDNSRRSSAEGGVGQPRMRPKASINQSGKNIQLGMFSVPWRKTDFDGAIRKVISQDFKSLAKYIDIFSPMVYHKMCGKATNWISEIVSYMDKITVKPILPIIQTEDKPKKISREEFKDEVKRAIRKPSQGAIIFFLEDLLKDKNKLAVIKEIF